MTTAAAIAIAQKDARDMLEVAGLVDGDKATKAQLAGDAAILYWDTAVKSKEASDRQVYLVWSLVSTAAESYADNDVRARDAFISFDLYTRRSKTSSKIVTLVAGLESAARSKGWSFEFNGPAEYERDAAIYHLSFNLFKILK